MTRRRDGLPTPTELLSAATSALASGLGEEGARSAASALFPTGSLPPEAVSILSAEAAASALASMGREAEGGSPEDGPIDPEWLHSFLSSLPPCPEDKDEAGLLLALAATASCGTHPSGWIAYDRAGVLRLAGLGRLGSKEASALIGRVCRRYGISLGISGRERPVTVMEVPWVAGGGTDPGRVVEASRTIYFKFNS